MPNSWLFTRDDESVFLSRAGKYNILVAGPGQQRQQLQFDDEAGVEDYQRQIAAQMASGGWILYGIDQQRRGRGPTASASGRTDRRVRT